MAGKKCLRAAFVQRLAVPLALLETPGGNLVDLAGYAAVRTRDARTCLLPHECEKGFVVITERRAAVRTVGRG